MSAYHSSTVIVLPRVVGRAGVWHSGPNSKRYIEWRRLVDDGAKLVPGPQDFVDYFAIVKEIVQQVEARERYGGHRRKVVRRVSSWFEPI